MTEVDTMSLSAAREWLRERVDHGERCPCCTQFAKVYRRRINSSSAFGLVTVYRQIGTAWGHIPSVSVKVAATGGEWARLTYWDLIEEATEKRDDGGRAGWWRITERGEQFALDRLRVQMYARIYDGRCLGMTGDLIGVRDALGHKFNYDELMRR